MEQSGQKAGLAEAERGAGGRGASGGFRGRGMGHAPVASPTVRLVCCTIYDS